MNNLIEFPRTTKCALQKVVVIIVAVLAMGFGFVQTSDAASRYGAMSWRLTSTQVNAGTPVSGSYQVSGLKSHSLLIFQRQFGSSRVWKTVSQIAVLNSGAGTFNLPSDPIGAFVYRAIVDSGGKAVIQSPNYALHSFGPVSLSVICQEHSGGDGGCGQGSVQLQNSTIYNYEFSDETSYQTPPGEDQLSFSSNSCNSGSLTITVGESDESWPGGYETFQIAQSASDPQLITIPDTSQEVFNFDLDGGPFILNDWITPAGNQYDEDAWYTGSFNCYTTNGLK